MTRGRKRARPATSSRTVEVKQPTLPDTRLPLRHTLNGYRMHHVDFTGAERLSVRTWSKGSARGEGPQQRRDGVAVAAAALWVPCERCPSLRPKDAAGRHGAMPTRAAVEGWPRCAHGVPYWEDCVGEPVPPPCCLEGAS
ncbi:hypothetical protein BO221_04805 [Archangium sp. Cb G35]|uniref:hypothetical protein n=1 Tax=Archangium sp. Cb G35 TaxID=1920190 RepID=UPI000937DF41|nr:hypothetical protein [Archangium sp. Cb G35]OJT27307.1 hypothetical protein BO221_04805 [Archangium sp. Cb G35]